LLQVEHERDYRLEESVYYDLVAKKTAALFSACCELGALATQADAAARERMKRFGECLGIAFQIKDDLLDYAGDAALLGKPVGNDIRENKITLPLIHALTQADEQQREEIIRLLEQDEVGEDKVKMIVRFVQEMGGLSYAENVARSYAEQAHEIIQSYPESRAKSSLITLAQFAISREN
jgi:octaprenyl-diphosphate synthase